MTEAKEAHALTRAPAAGAATERDAGTPQGPSRGRLTPVEIAGLVLGVAALLAAIAAWGDLTLLGKVASFVDVFLICAFLVLISRARDSIPLRSTLLIIFCFTLVCVTTGVSLANYKREDVAEAAIAGVKITLPAENAPVEACTEVRGQGTIPDGYQLWIFVAQDGVDDNNKPVRQYWVTERARPDSQPSEWSVPVKVGVGDTKSTGPGFQLYAVLVPDEWGNYLANSNGSGGFWATSLPPGAKDAEPRNVTRLRDPKSLGCKS